MLDQLNPEAILVEHLGFLQKVAFVTCRQSGLHGADAEDFASWLKIRLMEDDYAIIRKFRGESKVTTYLAMVVTRQLFAYLREQRGRWRPSAAAERLGPPADELEELVYREGYTLAQAGEKLRTQGRTPLSDLELAKLLNQLPQRQPLRATEVSSEAVPEPEGSLQADDRITSAEELARQADLAARIARALGQLKPDEQVMVRMYFQEGYSVADVARALKVDQKPLYRRIPKLRDRLRELLEDEGLSGPTFLEREDP